MQRIPQAITAAQLTTSAATYYTAPANTISTISALTATNTTGGAVTMTLHIVPSGGTASDTNKILSARSIAAGESYVVAQAIGQTLEAGATLQALAGANTSISLVGSVYETTV
jgi:hypothetical protein